MKVLIFILAAVISYLVAGINPAIAMSKLIYHEDIREKGSGNAGFTNFRRVYGNKWAWWVLTFDLFKGAVLAVIFGFAFRSVFGDFDLGAAYAGTFALLGHAFPVWYGFKGGKGFLTYLAVIFVIDWRAGLISVAVMMILLFTSHYMSLSTVIALLTAPITLWISGARLSVILMCLGCVLYIAVRHKENFERLIHGTENKFYLKKKNQEA